MRWYAQSTEQKRVQRGSRVLARTLQSNLQPCEGQTSACPSVCLSSTDQGLAIRTGTDYFRRNDYDRHVFIERPYLGPLLFDNNDSDARDHCAAERCEFLQLTDTPTPEPP